MYIIIKSLKLLLENNQAIDSSKSYIVDMVLKKVKQCNE